MAVAVLINAVVFVSVLFAFALAIMLLVRTASPTAEQRAAAGAPMHGSALRDSRRRWMGAVRAAPADQGIAFSRASPPPGDASLSPPLPPDYMTQPAWAFRDVTGAFCFELHRVYGPPEADADGEPIRRLHERLSYWRAIGPTASGSGHSGRATWMTYARVCELPGRRPTFEQFCSLDEMHDRLRALLAVDAVTLAPLPGIVE